MYTYTKNDGGKNVKWLVEFKDSQGMTTVEYFDKEDQAKVFCAKVKGILKTCDGLPKGAA
jgi:hypothetical protein